MTIETFRRAVDSLEGYVGTVGIMGGEPTLNPEFPQMAAYIAKKRHPKRADHMLRPQRDFMAGIRDLEFENTFWYDGPHACRQTVDGCGLWATTLANYKKYYELIQDTIAYQALNDHSRPSYHQPALISRKSLCIPDDAWVKLRDNCWLQNLWSATITPKGAFFCEIAGALDMLFNGPGGWDITPGWWKKMPNEFGDQLQWCELCGLALTTFSRNANERVYDVSPDLHEKLKQTGSKIVDTVQENIITVENGLISEDSKAAGKWFNSSMPYTEGYGTRFDATTTKLTYKEIFAVLVLTENDDTELALKNAVHFSEVWCYAPNSILETLKSAMPQKIDAHYIDTENHTMGYLLYESMKQGNIERYAFIVQGNLRIKNALDDMKQLVLNPGTLLFSAYEGGENDDYFSAEGEGRTVLLNGMSRACQRSGWDRILKLRQLDELREIYPNEKIFPFSCETVYVAPALSIYPEKRYVVYGAGNNLRGVLRRLAEKKAIIVAVTDSASEKWGQDVAGFSVVSPEQLIDGTLIYDYIAISSSVYFCEIKKKLTDMGIPVGKLSWVL